MSLLVAITGPDGSGKSTACREVRRLLEPKHSVTEVSVWDAMSEAFPSKRDAEKYLADLDGCARCLFIFHALARALQLAERAQPQVLLLNGYWYKYAVSELGYGTERTAVFGAAGFFPKPDATFYLPVTPEEAWKRRQAASGYEQGGAREGGDARLRFLEFQAKLRDEWSGLLQSAHGSGWVKFGELTPPSEVAAAIVEGIEGRL